jgi:uncharacterized protein (TIRG00374 family)
MRQAAAILIRMDIIKYTQPLRYKISLRKLLVVCVLLLGAGFVLFRFSEVQAVLATLQQGNWMFVILAAVTELAWLVSVGAVYHAIYRSMGIDESIPKLMMLSSAATFVNVVAPSGVGMGGMAVLVSEARRRGYSSAGVIVAGYLYVLFDYVSFICILAAGLLVLVEQNELETAELAATALLLATVAVLAVLIFLGMCSANQLAKILSWGSRQVNHLAWPILQRAWISEEGAAAFGSDVVEGLRLLRRHPRDLIIPTALSLVSKGLLVTVLFLMFLSFNVPLSFGTLIAGFSVGYLYMIVSPTPSGIGVVEGALPLALGSLHIPIAAAAVVVLSYRGITFWLPLLFGMLAFRWLSRRKKISI